MSVSDLKTQAAAAQSAIHSFKGGLTGDPLGYVAYIVSLVAEALVMLPQASQLAATPPGDPGAAGEASQRYEEASERAQAVADDLGAIASTDLPDAVIGEAGNSLAEVLSAFVTVASSDATGLHTAAKAFSVYQSDLSAAVSTHVGGAEAISDGQQYLGSINVNLFAIANPLTASVEIRRVLRALVRGLEMVLDGLEICETAYGMAYDAGLALRRRMSDSHGYARLADIDIPEGQTSFDALVARTALPDGTDNPDDAILSEQEWANYSSEWATLSDAEREQFLAALRDADSADVRAVLMSALATGAGLAAALALAAAMKGMTPAQVAEIINLDVTSNDTATAGGMPFDQYNDKTCGTTSLLMLAAQSDPFLAYWLATGQLADGHVPAFLEGFDLSEAGSTAEDRMAWAQQSVQDRANDLPGVLPYPNIAGTAPGGAVDEAGLTGTEYEISWNSLAGIHSDPSEALTEAAEAANQGQPSLLLVGDTDGLIPMHYVLITGYHDGSYTIYEPYSGETFSVSETTLLEGSDAGIEGFGWWKEVYAVITPVD